jgi:Scramblase
VRALDSIGVGDPFDFPELRIRQPGKLIPGRASYEIFDAGRQLLAVAAETEGRPRLQTITRMMSDTRTLAVTTAAGEPVLTLVKRDSEWVAELIDPAGALIGRIRIGGSRRHYTLLDEQDEVAGEAVGNLAVNDFSVTGANGERYAKVRKTWAGLRKELLTSADHYSVTFTGPMPPRVRTLVVMMPIVLDLARYGPN